MGNGKVQQTNHSSPVTRGILPASRPAPDANALAASPRFDHDFSKVKVHADSGVQLRRQLGTSKTTSPIASVSPRTEMLKQLTDETTLFSNANVIAEWVKGKAPAPAAGTTGTPVPAPPAFTFTTEELLNDKALVKKIKPKPAKAEDLTAMLDLLVSYGFIERAAAATPGTPATPGSPGTPGTPASFTLKRDPKTQQPDLTTFNKDKKSVKDFTDKFEKRQERPSSLDPVVETSVLSGTLAAGAADEFKAEKTAETNLAKLKKDLEDLDKSGATDEKTQEKRKALEVKIAKAEKTFTNAQGFHTFAADVTNLLTRLGAANSDFKAGTYPGHSWGEFSADIFLSASLEEVKDIGDYSGKYWNRKKVRKFFDDLNDECEKDDPTTGKFAWRAIYNDVPLAGEINKKFGAGRVVQKENHGPDGKKLHIHLDLRPIKQRLDTKSGFEINKGRIKIL